MNAHGVLDSRSQAADCSNRADGHQPGANGPATAHQAATLVISGVAAHQPSTQRASCIHGRCCDQRSLEPRGFGCRHRPLCVSASIVPLKLCRAIAGQVDCEAFDTIARTLLARVVASTPHGVTAAHTSPPCHHPHTMLPRTRPDSMLRTTLDPNALAQLSRMCAAECPTTSPCCRWSCSESARHLDALPRLVPMTRAPKKPLLGCQRPHIGALACRRMP